ncbi:MAG: UDP-N-acetylglucosamine 1-carboxyvinyltransferase [Clostridiales bacterium]|nr:UDP-N-acetylglucosamine 1-carboxyvinyltransferase [Clostridiales bacterium]
MGAYRVCGGKKISGELTIGGGKNAILPILASVILNSGVSVLHNCPRIADTFTSIEILETIGCKVAMEGNTLIIDSSGADKCEIPEKLVGKMRSSIIFMGGVLGRFRTVKISYPGGCELGLRPINYHLKALTQLGAEITDEHGFIIAKADKLRGTKINLDFPSVGATENTMLAAVFAEGETMIVNAAKEPEIADLQNFLNACGAKIKGAGTDAITIRGVPRLHGAEYTIMPDRIAAGTFLAAAAVTGGSVTLRNVMAEHLYPITSKLTETGCGIQTRPGIVSLTSPGKLRALDRLRTCPHPGFPTDMQPQMTALLCTANGTSIVEETMFESRNRHVNELMRMGADIILAESGRTAIIKGVKKLKGSTVSSKDLRGGAALILAGLAAEGTTTVTNSEHVERGYERIEHALTQLGADVVHLCSESHLGE